MRFARAVVLPCLVAASLAPGSAPAATINVEYFNQAVAACQAALPAFDGLIRKRPKALVNEGTTAAFVTCAPTVQRWDLGTMGSFQVSLSNRNTGGVTISCTRIDGMHDGDFNSASTKSVHVMPNQHAVLSWFPADSGTGSLSMPAVSCQLPPRTEIIGIAYIVRTEIGN